MSSKPTVFFSATGIAFIIVWRINFNSTNFFGILLLQVESKSSSVKENRATVSKIFAFARQDNVYCKNFSGYLSRTRDVVPKASAHSSFFNLLISRLSSSSSESLGSILSIEEALLSESPIFRYF
jgi:hypothetical protein